MDDLRLRARAAGGWLCCAVLIGVLGSTPVTAAKKPKTQPVLLVNTLDAPGLIQDVATAEPVQVGATGSLAGVLEVSQNLPYVVPEGRRLIVRAVSVAASVPTGQSLLVAVGDSGDASQFFIPITKQGTLSTQDWFVGSTPHHLVYEAGETPALYGARSSSSGGGAVRVDLHGTLVPLVLL